MITNNNLASELEDNTVDKSIMNQTPDHQLYLVTQTDMNQNTIDNDTSPYKKMLMNQQPHGYYSNAFHNQQFRTTNMTMQYEQTDQEQATPRKVPLGDVMMARNMGFPNMKYLDPET